MFKAQRFSLSQNPLALKGDSYVGPVPGLSKEVNIVPDTNGDTHKKSLTNARPARIDTCASEYIFLQIHTEC